MNKTIAPYQPQRFEDRLEGKRGEIIRATFECIAELGIAATSTRAIASKAKVNQGIIHYYFNSKEELLRSVLEVIVDNSIKNIEAITGSSLSVEERIRGILQDGLSLIGPRQKEFIVSMALWSHAMALGGEIRVLHQRLFRRLLAAVEAVVEEGERSGSFRPGSSKVLSLFIIGLIGGLGLQYVMNPTEIQPDGVIELVDFAFEKILPS